MDSETYEENVMMLIVNAGQCRSMLMRALSESRQGNYELAEGLVEEARSFMNEAHKTQTALMAYDEGEGKLPVQIVMVHAQDHLMNAVLLMDLTTELIEIHKKL